MAFERISFKIRRPIALGPGLRSRTPTNTMSRILMSDPGSLIGLSLASHSLPRNSNSWNGVIEMVQFLLKLLLKQNSCCDNDLHWLQVAAKSLTAKLHSRYLKESQICKGRSRTFTSNSATLDRPVVLNRGGTLPKGGASPSALCNMEILINKFTNKHICFYNLFKVRGAWSKGQLHEGAVEEKMKNHGARQTMRPSYDADFRLLSF